MTRTRYGITPWIDELPKRRRPEFPRLRESAAFPVVIVGGGLAGIFTAYAFSAAGIRVALVEADRIGHAGASRGPGVLHGEASSSYREVEQRHGRRVARAMFDASRRAVLDLAAAARRLGVREIATGDAFCVAASYTADGKALAREVALRRDAGLDATWLRPSALARDTRVESAVAGARYGGWGVAQPYRLLTTFAAAAVERGATFFERSPVQRVLVRPKHVEIQADGGTLAADTVVVCTGEPTKLYRSLQRHVRPDEQYVVLTERLPSALRKQVTPAASVLSDTDAPRHLVRWLDDGRVVVSGADQRRPPERQKERVLVQRTGQLMYELTRLVPAISGILPAYGWDVPVGTTADGVMYAGPHRNFPRHLFAWATRHDPAQAYLASRILLRHYTGTATRQDRYFAFTRG